MNPAALLFEQSLDWLRDNYDRFLFRTEYDVVTMLWGYMVRAAKAQERGIIIDYEHNVAVTSGRLQCDIVALSAKDEKLLCAEVKYEPSRTRPDVVSRKLKHSRPQHLLPDHGLKDHRCDIEKARLYVDQGRVQTAYAVLVDENSYHYGLMKSQQLTLPEGVSWIEWGAKTPDGFDTAIMIYRYPPLAD
jgi:hypothetical protein